MFLTTKIKYEIIDLINKININKASDIFGFPANVIKILLHEIAPVLCCIFSEIFSTRTFLVHKKMALISHIYNGGSRLEVSNYRPVSILPIISKIFKNSRMLN